MPFRDAPARLKNFEGRLRDRPRMKPFSGREWAAIPNKAGIYAIWKSRTVNKPVYVGESSDLRDRMNDLKNWNTHTFAKQIKQRYRYSGLDSLRERIRQDYFISYLTVSFGRSEAESYLIHKWETFNHFNDASPRYLATLDLELVDVE